MKTFCTFNDNNAVESIVQTGGEMPPYGSGWVEVPNDWGGKHGDKREWFSDTMHRILDEDLVREGKRKDNRSKKFYKKDDPSETMPIQELDEDASTDYTDQEPLSGDDAAYQKWDERKNKWVVDSEKKERAEKKNQLDQMYSEMDKLESDGNRNQQEITAGINVEENTIELRKKREKILHLRANAKPIKAELDAAEAV